MDDIEELSRLDPREVYEEMNSDDWEDAIGEFNHPDYREDKKEEDARWVE